MKRIVKLLMVICLGLMLLIPAESTAKTIKFTIAGTLPAGDMGMMANKRWAEAMARESGGVLQMDLMPGGVLGGDKQLLEQLSLNQIQVHMAGPVIVHHLLKEYQCLEAEYVYEDEAHGRRVWDGPIGEEVNQALLKKYNIRLVGMASRGSRNLTCNKKVVTPSDMQGIKIRVTNPLRVQVFKAYGALPGPMAFPELYGALKTGVYEAQENPITTIFASKFYEVQKFIVLTAHIWSYYTYTANNDFFKSLSPKHQKIFMDTWRKYARDPLDKEVPRKIDELLTKMEKEHGVTVIRNPDLRAFMEKARPIVIKFAAKNCRPNILDDVAKFAK